MEAIIVPKRVEQINDYLFVDTYKSSKTICVDEMSVNDREMCAIWKKKLGKYRIYKYGGSLGEYKQRRKGRVKESSF